MTGSRATTGSSRIVRLGALPCLALLAGFAAPAPEADLRSLAATDARVLAIAHRLQTQGRAFCSRQDAEPGLILHHVEQYAERLRPAARRAFGLDRDIAVLAVAPGGASDRAGIRPGDSILAVDGSPAPDTGPVLRRLGMLADRLRPRPGRDITVTVGRGGQRRTLVLPFESACRSRVQLLPSRRPRAWADGRLVTVTTALVEFTRTDEELAFVIGHEVAHNALGHEGRGDRRARELAADALAIRLMRAAGYATAGVPGFVDRLYRGPAGGLLASVGHLGRRERQVALARELIRP